MLSRAVLVGAGSLLIQVGVVHAQAPHWPQWRGPDRNGVSTAVDLPLEWGPSKNVLWKAEIEGRGHSSPVIWDKTIFVTTDIEGEVIPGAHAPVHLRAGEPYLHPAAGSADRRHTLKILAIDADTGRTRWSRTVHDGPVFDNRHRNNTYATPTATTDGERVYVYFGSQGLFAFDFEGTLVWDVDFGDIATWGHGHGTSPLLFENLLILQLDQNEGEGSVLLALDKVTGQEIWKTPREERINYSSPVLIGSGDRLEIVTTSYHNVIAYDVRTGEERWRSPGFLGNAIPTVVADDRMVFAVSGYPDKITRAIRIPTASDVPATVDAVWEYRKGSGYTPSPLLYRGYLYLVSDKGILTCIEPETGEIVYEGGRIPVPTFVRASPVAWEDKILLSGEEGDFFVVQAGPEHKVLAQSSIDERVIASPAVAHGRLYIRSEEHLYAIGRQDSSLESADGGFGAQGTEHVVPSRPETVTWGWFPIDRPPVLTIQSGDTVRIDTLTHAGTTQDEDPETFLGGFGVARDEILEDVVDFWASRAERPREGRSGHVITGPIYVDGAEPGDMLEVQVLDLNTRVPYGINSTSSTSGVFDPRYPGMRQGDPPLDIPRTRHLIRTALVDGREVALFSPGIQVPLAPFMGIMAVAPADPVVGQPGVTVSGVQSSRPPGAFGGNMDVKDLTAGSTLYLPVFHPGARFYVGDPHSAQGDGEVSGTAIEHSLSGVFRFIVHKGRTITGPRAETDTHYIMMGIDLDLDRALRMAVREVVTFLVEEKELSPSKAFSLASIAVDFQVAEAVDLTQLVSGKIPKSLFLEP